MSIQYISTPIFQFKKGGNTGKVVQKVSNKVKQVASQAKQAASQAKQMSAKAANATSTANAAANAAANATSTANAAAQQVSRLTKMYDKLKSFVPDFISNHPVRTSVIGSSVAGLGIGAALFGGDNSTPQQAYAIINGVKVPIAKGDDGVFVLSNENAPANDLDAAVAAAMSNNPQQQINPNTPQQQQGQIIGNQPLDMNNINYQSPYISQPQIDYSQIDIQAVNDLFDDDQW